jgi:two-component system nitrogen regulation sensor histidine kinase GlnL
MIDAPLEEAFRRARAQQSSLSVNDVDVGSGERPPLQCNLHFAPLLRARGRCSCSSRRARWRRASRRTPEPEGREVGDRHGRDAGARDQEPLGRITGAAQLSRRGLSGEDLELTDLIVEESRRIVKLLEQVEQFGNVRPPKVGR